MIKKTGIQSMIFEKPPCILAASSVVGQKEGEGPLGPLFDEIETDPKFGMKTWEEAESQLQERAAHRVLKKAGLEAHQLTCIFAGDLLGQLIATSFGLQSFQKPIFGLYGACSTMGEGLILSAIAAASGYAHYSMVLTSSHFAGAEKEFRFPLPYGNQRPLSATWTVVGSAGVIVTDHDIKNRGIARITAATPGKIVDFGVKDSMNMGAAMAPAACDTICRHLIDFQRKPEDYDAIITGDLGKIGQHILLDLADAEGFSIVRQHMDCGMMIFDSKTQDTHAGGSGCGCSAVTFASFILKKIKSGEWKRVLFVPTGALLSPVSFNEGKSVPGIAHAVVIEKV